VSMVTACSVVGGCFLHTLQERRDKIERLLIPLNDEFARVVDQAMNCFDDC
jgi:hypothetical protein